VTQVSQLGRRGAKQRLKLSRAAISGLPSFNVLAGGPSSLAWRSGGARRSYRPKPHFQSVAFDGHHQPDGHYPKSENLPAQKPRGCTGGYARWGAIQAPADGVRPSWPTTFPRTPHSWLGIVPAWRSAAVLSGLVSILAVVRGRPGRWPSRRRAPTIATPPVAVGSSSTRANHRSRPPVNKADLAYGFGPRRVGGLGPDEPPAWPPRSIARAHPASLVGPRTCTLSSRGFLLGRILVTSCEAAPAPITLASFSLTFSSATLGP
jgi:hypothetical protein